MSVRPAPLRVAPSPDEAGDEGLTGRPSGSPGVGSAELEARLVLRAKGGDGDAWARLYQDHFDDLLRHIAYMTGDVSVAEDVVQEAFANALAGLAKFDGRAAFATWIRVIADNLVRKHWRKDRRRTRAFDRVRAAPPLDGVDLEDDVQRDRMAEALTAALDTLPPHLREAFVLIDIEGLPSEVAARRIGISAGNLRVRTTRARARLREELQRAGMLGEVRR